VTRTGVACPSPEGYHIGSVDPYALKIQARTAECLFRTPLDPVATHRNRALAVWLPLVRQSGPPRPPLTSSGDDHPMPVLRRGPALGAHRPCDGDGHAGATARILSDLKPNRWTVTCSSSRSNTGWGAAEVMLAAALF
jgi:hypothetical protein